MTQIGEAIKPEFLLDGSDPDCPFDHENPEPPTVVNDLIGVGTKLAKSLKGATSTRLYKPMETTPGRVPDPRAISTHPFYKKAKAIVIPATSQDGKTVYEHTYPVTCAAHHILPGQESFKVSPLLAYMVKKGDSEPLKGETYTKGVVWADVGYNVNGSENGVWLPGSYAVGGGRGGMDVWDDNTDGDADGPDEDAATEVVSVASSSGATKSRKIVAGATASSSGEEVHSASSGALTGALNEISAGNRKWQYVKQAVKLTPGQFHDRHVDYSKFVQEVLQKIFEDLNSSAKKQVFAGACDKCKAKSDDIKKLGIPTSFGLLNRLDAAASRLRGLLRGSTWRRNIYTSKWGAAYMQAVLDKNPDAN
jgi:hypothetical protein